MKVSVGSLKQTSSKAIPQVKLGKVEILNVRFSSLVTQQEAGDGGSLQIT